MKIFVGIVLALVVGSSSLHHVVAATSSLVESPKTEEEAKKSSLRGRSLFGCMKGCGGGGGNPWGGGGSGGNPQPRTTPAPPTPAPPTAAPTPSGPYWEDITFDNFESGWGNFKDVSDSNANDPTDAILMSNPNQRQWVYQGDASLRIRGNSGVDSSVWHKNNHDVTGYDNLKVRFWYAARTFNSGESFVLEYSSDGGSSYNVMKEFVYQVDFENDDFNLAIVNFNQDGPSYALTDQARIRFRCTASGNGDYIYLDKVRFMGQINP